MIKILVSLFIFTALQYLSWYVHPLFVLISWIPLLLCLDECRTPTKKFLCTLVFITVYNIVVVYWLAQINHLKGSGAIAINILGQTFFLCCAFIFAVKTKWLHYLLFSCIWVSYEYLNHVWVFTFPWLTVGNVFGSKPEFVQWYSITGVLGGSFWVLWINILIYEAAINWKKHTSRVPLYIGSFVFLFPIIASLIMYKISFSNKIGGQLLNVMIVHTNMSDSNRIPDDEKIKLFLATNPNIEMKTDYLIFPELFFDEFDTWMGEFKNSVKYSKLKRIALNHPNTSLILGIYFNKENSDGINTTSTNVRYNRYNCAVQIDTTKVIQLKIKKVYVPFDEYMPSFARSLKINSARYSEMPGNINSFISKTHKAFISICYESINSVFYATNWRDENVIIMLASEAFLKGNTSAMNQYLNICRLRALETNKEIFKASNAGYSTRIAHNGDYERVTNSNKMFTTLTTTGVVYTNRSFYISTSGIINFVYPIGIILTVFYSLFGKQKIHDREL
jgi:apolipoprotein N-acyltransferase